MSPRVQQVAETVRNALQENGIEWEQGVGEHEFVLTLPGEKKLRTVVSLVVGERAVSVSSFVIRNPDENHEAFYRHLLRRNLRMPGLAYSTDTSGDVYVVGQVPPAAVDDSWVDQVCGALLHACDEPFNDLLLLGFRSSMQKEWDWRIDRGESVRNLEAFRHVLERG